MIYRGLVRERFHAELEAFPRLLVRSQRESQGDQTTILGSLACNTHIRIKVCAGLCQYGEQQHAKVYD